MSSTPIQTDIPSSQRRPTMAQVAEASGVARSTVSGILSQRPDCTVRPETRKRVFDAIKKLGYRPNINAQSLVTGKTMTLGVVVAGLDVETSNAMLMTFETLAREQGYLCLLMSNPNEPEVEDKILKLLEARSVDGLLLFPCETGPHRQLEQLLERGMPVVTIDNHDRVGLPVDDVSVDHFQGGVMQAKHLLALGRRRVCVVNSAFTCEVVERRIAGLTRHLLEHGAPTPIRIRLPFRGRPAYHRRTWTDENRQNMHDALQSHLGQFDVIVGAGDAYAVLAMACLNVLNVRIPEDVAVIGYDGTSLVDNVFMPLTSVGTPTTEVAKAAIDILFKRIHGRSDDDEPITTLIPPTLIERASTIGRVKQV